VGVARPLDLDCRSLDATAASGRGLGQGRLGQAWASVCLDARPLALSKSAEQKFTPCGVEKATGVNFLFPACMLPFLLLKTRRPCYVSFQNEQKRQRSQTLLLAAGHGGTTFSSQTKNHPDLLNHHRIDCIRNSCVADVFAEQPQVVMPPGA
jgi:hypothetical protein